MTKHTPEARYTREQIERAVRRAKLASVTFAGTTHGIERAFWAELDAQALPKLELYCVYAREAEGLPGRADGRCVHCGHPETGAIHGEEQRRRVQTALAKARKEAAP